jgi:hypothetical protein
VLMSSMFCQWCIAHHSRFHAHAEERQHRARRDRPSWQHSQASRR